MTTPEDQTRRDAAAALARAERISVATDRDARVFATGTALSGVVLGGYLAVWAATAPRGNVTTALLAAYLVIAGAIAWWQHRAARAIPSGAQRTAQSGLLASIAVALALTLVTAATPWAHHRMPIPGAILFGLAVAAPMAIGARAVLGRHRAGNAQASA